MSGWNPCSLTISVLIVFAATASMTTAVQQGTNKNETEAIIFLDNLNTEAQILAPLAIETAWTYNTNITSHNEMKMIEATLVGFAAAYEARAKALEFDRTDFSYDTARMLEKMIYIGDAAMEDREDLVELTILKAGMQSRYSTGKPCDDDGICYPLEPDLTQIMAESRNYDELYWAWDAWRDEVGAPARDDYIRYVELKNLGADANDQPDAGAFWRSWYQIEDFEDVMRDLIDQLMPLYQNLHAFVRRKLYNVYGEDYINLQGPIPAHILGNMWAQSWLPLYDLCEPFPDKPSVDITPALVEQGYDALKMFETSDEFFTSLGLTKMPDPFWDKSMIEKPDDGREVVCHASAWDFFNQIDFRIKQCTDITHDDFLTVHHEMGHIEYFLQYMHQHVLYRSGANPGFHEAVGDVLALSVSTPKHLETIGLLDEAVDDPEADLNFLMSIALDKIAFLPFGYLMDEWRWRVFDGSTPPGSYNEDWWDVRLMYQGIIPPVTRTEDDFDPAAKYHIAADVPYIRYFISYIIQFQFHDALCKAAGQTGPLYKCDIYQSHEAGDLLADMLKTGSSRPWPEAMEAITGSPDMNATALVMYFQPLIDYLEEQNANNGDVLGWDVMYTPKEPYSGSGSFVQPSVALLFSAIILIVSTMVQESRYD